VIAAVDKIFERVYRDVALADQEEGRVVIASRPLKDGRMIDADGTLRDGCPCPPPYRRTITGEDVCRECGYLVKLHHFPPPPVRIIAKDGFLEVPGDPLPPRRRPRPGTGSRGLG